MFCSSRCRHFGVATCGHLWWSSWLFQFCLLTRLFKWWRLLKQRNFSHSHTIFLPVDWLNEQLPDCLHGNSLLQQFIANWPQNSFPAWGHSSSGMLIYNLIGGILACACVFLRHSYDGLILRPLQEQPRRGPCSNQTAAPNNTTKTKEYASHIF